MSLPGLSLTPGSKGQNKGVEQLPVLGHFPYDAAPHRHPASFTRQLALGRGPGYYPGRTESGWETCPKMTRTGMPVQI